MPEWSELIVIMLVAMVVFGPHRLPAMARKAGRMMAEFRVAARELREGIEKELAVEDMREAAKDVLDSTRDASRDLRQSLSESERSLKSTPPLAKPTDTQPGTERSALPAAPDDPDAATGDANESPPLSPPAALPDAGATPVPGDGSLADESEPAPQTDQQR